MKTIKFSNLRKDLTIKPKHIIELAKLCYEPWKRDYQAAEKTWRTEKLPALEQKIDEHNKEVQAKKSVYSFNTYLPIGETDKKTIVEKEKDFYIYTSQKVYEFNSKFEIEYLEKSVTESTPEFLEEVDWTQVKKAAFAVKSKDSNKAILFEIGITGSYPEGLKYEISGTSNWVKSTKIDIEEIIKKGSNPHFITFHKGKIAFFIAIFISFTFYSLLLKIFEMYLFNHYLDISAPIAKWSILLSVFIFSLRWINIKVEESFPNFSILDKYSPFENGSIKALWVALGTIVVNGLYDLSKYIIFKK